ncbi:hypothetical protein CU669_00180 [Paramagnetospirillum kuznetsovii]|uniref:Glycosyltransferase RgtA/B/C/D-like domain-containing protein n=1 Tax=Paramagnetospirillum kuznetsovii TaxID=2053833 RepID=A0A364P2R6_9PROT|nr:hypothetical protein [Paramagnetospirillum kuznetsovii]RAU23560.1 hypothetical protein CU669_00180 [Paramagnetospirillum kuznetsovii]
MATAAFLTHRVKAEPSRRAILGAGFGWVALTSLLYWVAGPYSFAIINQELDYAVPLYAFVAGLPEGTQFAHGFAAGNDVFGMSPFSGQLVSLDRFLLTHLPLWLAFTVNRILATSLGLMGGYLICRRWGRCDRITAFGVSALATVAGEFTTTVVWTVGLGYAILPLMVYAVVLRQGKRHYWLGVLAVAILNALSCTPTHSMVATCATLGFTMLLVGPKAALRAVPGTAVVVLVVILVWHEMLFGMASLGVWSYRASLAVDSPPILEVIARLTDMASIYKETFAALALAILSLWRGGWKRAMAPTAITAALFMAPLILFQTPWSRIGLKPLGAFNFTYLLYGLPVVVILLMAQAGQRWNGRAPLVGILVCALAVGRLAWLDAYQASVWLSQGGVNTVSTEALKTAPWRPVEPTRVVSVPYRLPANVAASAGFDTLDGFTALLPRSLGIWWEWAIGPVKEKPNTGNLTLETQIDLKCCRRYDMAKLINLDALRIANVGIILSRLPLGGEGLRLISATDDSVSPPRTDTPRSDALRSYVGYLAKPPPIHAYGLDSPLPRVFAATSLHLVADDAGDEAMVRDVLSNAMSRAAVLRATDGTTLDAPDRWTMTITAATLVENGFDIVLDAPDGGIAIINTPWMPFWKARVDGVARPVVSANVIHLAVAVPPGGKRLELRWDRPLLRHKLLGAP